MLIVVHLSTLYFLLMTVKSAQVLQTTQNTITVLLKSTRGNTLIQKKDYQKKMLWQYSCHDSIMQLTNTEATRASKRSVR